MSNPPPKPRTYTEEQFITFHLAYGEISPLSVEPADICALLGIKPDKENRKNVLVEILHFVGQYRVWRQKQYSPAVVTPQQVQIEDVVEDAYGKVLMDTIEKNPERPFEHILKPWDWKPGNA